MKINLTNKNRRSAFLLVAALASPGISSASASPIVAGDFDNFGNQSTAADTLVIRPTFASYLARSGPGGNNDFWHNGAPMPFDVHSTNDDNWEFGYTFENLPQLNPEARLLIRLQSVSGSNNDSLSLQFTGTENSFSSLWSGGIDELDAHFGGSGTWETGKSVILDIRLGDLPFTNGQSIVDNINQVGYLDVYLHDDTAVDWIQVIVPAPGSASLLAAGSLIALRRRRS